MREMKYLAITGGVFFLGGKENFPYRHIHNPNLSLGSYLRALLIAAGCDNVIYIVSLVSKSSLVNGFIR